MPSPLSGWAPAPMPSMEGHQGEGNGGWDRWRPEVCGSRPNQAASLNLGAGGSSQPVARAGLRSPINHLAASLTPPPSSCSAASVSLPPRPPSNCLAASVSLPPWPPSSCLAASGNLKEGRWVGLCWTQQAPCWRARVGGGLGPAHLGVIPPQQTGAWGGTLPA